MHFDPVYRDDVPVLETGRLRLRAHRVEDLEPCVAMWSEPEVTRFTIGEPSPAPRTWSRLLAYRGHWAVLGFGYWAVELKATGLYVGEVGFADFKRGLHPSLEEFPEAGWALTPLAHGKGYATEALEAALAWADARFPRTVCIIHPHNHASLRVAEKVGYRRFAETAKPEEPDLLLARDRRR